MIDWISNRTIKNFSINSSPIISSPFVLTSDNKIYQNVIATLFEEYLKQLQKNQNKIFIQFHKKLICEVIRFKEGDGQPGTARSLKFMFYENWLQLKNSSIPKEFQSWIQRISKKINQIGFHENFKAIKKIGKGGFASVYLVRRKSNQQQIAVKAFSKDAIAAENKGIDALENEINVMRKLQHKNLMKLYQVFETQNSYYICVQLLSGGSLFDKIKRKVKIAPQKIKKIMKSILEGLQYMHSKNIMHRDIKPENILFKNSTEQQCMIADFGLGQQCHEDEYLFSRCGTPGYVAPEIVSLKNGQNTKYGTACDLFSLGVIFHILALRRAPFQGRSHNQVLTQNKSCDIDFEQAQYKRLPQTWLDLLKKLLQKDPKKRITASEAIDHKFFTEDQMFKDFTLLRRKQSQEKNLKQLDKIQTVNTCDSNILLASDKIKRNNIRLRQDSCMKFIMRENIITGKVSESSQNIQEIESPKILKKTFRPSGESRFKYRA